MPKTPGSEQRQYKRLNFNSKLKATLYLISDDGTQSKASTCVVAVKDFSKSGIGVFTDIQVALQKMVRIMIDGVNAEPLEGRVVWCGPSANDSTAPRSLPYRIGIDFMPRDDAARENQLAVYQHLKRLAEELENSSD